MGARYYDPVLSRFVEPDPVVPEPGDPQSWNRYSFVRNNPFNRVDPTGSIDLGALAGGTFVQHFGGNRAAGELFGSLGGSVVPGVGELADVGVVFSLDHKVGTGVRLAATASILLGGRGVRGYAVAFQRSDGRFFAFAQSRRKKLINVWYGISVSSESARK